MIPLIIFLLGTDSLNVAPVKTKTIMHAVVNKYATPCDGFMIKDSTIIYYFKFKEHDNNRQNKESHIKNDDQRKDDTMER